jgi:capsule polysaccharide export protein KpsE/RkpR
LNPTRTLPVPETVLESETMEESLLREDERETSLLPYLQWLWFYRRSLYRAAAYGLLASILLAVIIPVRFKSTTRLMPPDGQSGSGLAMLSAMTGQVGAGALGGLAAEMLGIKSSGELFVGILSSQTVQDRLINQFHMQQIYGDSKIEDAEKDLAKRTDISIDRKSGIISIVVTDHDPKRAAAIAQAYVVELNRLVAEVSTSSARRERIFLEDRLKQVRTDLDDAAKKFSDFASKNIAIDIPAQGKAMVEAAAALQGELIAAQSELSGLQQIYSNNNVRVRSAGARVKELQRKLNELGEGTQASGGQNSLYPSIRQLPLLGVTYADLYRENKIQETVYGLLTQQYEMAKIQEAKEIPTVKVLDPAIVPTKKSFPPRLLIIILGTMLGVTLAMTWITAKTHWEAVSSSDPRKEFAQEVFSTLHARIPRLSRNGNSAGSKNGHRPVEIEIQRSSTHIEPEAPVNTRAAGS